MEVNEKVIAQWFDAASRYDGADVIETLLLAGFDPDTRDGEGKNALDYVAKASADYTMKEHARHLVDALKSKYEEEPEKLRDALGYKRSIGSWGSRHGEIKSELQDEIDRVSIELQGPELWFEACQGPGRIGVLEAYLNKGFDVDTRDDEGRSALWHAMNSFRDGYTSARDEINLLLDHLETKYQGYPKELLAALDESRGLDTGRYDNGNIIHKKVKGIMERCQTEIRDPALWFEASKGSGRKQILEAYLNKGFDVDTRDDEGRSALWHAMNSFRDGYTSARDEINLLLDHLETKYQGYPKELLAALDESRGLDTGRYDNGNKIHKKVKGIMERCQTDMLDPALWFEASKGSGRKEIFEAYLDKDFDVDTRDNNGYSALWRVSQQLDMGYDAQDVAGFLLDKLEEKYQGDPEKLLSVLREDGVMPQESYNVSKSTKKRIKGIMERCQTDMLDPALWFEASKGSGRKEIFEAYLDKDFDVDTRDNNGYSALWRVSQQLDMGYDAQDVAGFLLDKLEEKYQGDPEKLLSVLREDGVMPQESYNVSKSTKKRIKEMIEGCQAQLHDPALWFAASKQKGTQDILAQYIANNVDVITTDEAGKTVLDYIVQRRDADQLKAFVSTVVEHQGKEKAAAAIKQGEIIAELIGNRRTFSDELIAEIFSSANGMRSAGGLEKGEKYEALSDQQKASFAMAEDFLTRREVSAKTIQAVVKAYNSQELSERTQAMMTLMQADEGFDVSALHNAMEEIKRYHQETQVIIADGRQQEKTERDFLRDNAELISRPLDISSGRYGHVPKLLAEKIGSLDDAIIDWGYYASLHVHDRSEKEHKEELRDTIQNILSVYDEPASHRGVIDIKRARNQLSDELLGELVDKLYRILVTEREVIRAQGSSSNASAQYNQQQKKAHARLDSLYGDRESPVFRR